MNYHDLRWLRNTDNRYKKRERNESGHNIYIDTTNFFIHLDSNERLQSLL